MGRRSAEGLGALLLPALAVMWELAPATQVCWLIAGIIMALVWGESSRRIIAIPGLVAALVFICLGARLNQEPPPSSAALDTYFIPERSEDGAIYGVVSVKNGTGDTLNITAARLNASDDYEDSELKV